MNDRYQLRRIDSDQIVVELQRHDSFGPQWKPPNKPPSGWVQWWIDRGGTDNWEPLGPEFRYFISPSQP